MRYRKLMSLFVMIAIFGSVGGVAWAILRSHAQYEFSNPEQIRDAAIAYIKANHPETQPFTENIAWTGGRENSNLPGTEIYVYRHNGWNVTIDYSNVANPVYRITADYSTVSAPGDVSVLYRVSWQGTWENRHIMETRYTFAQ